MAQNVSTTPVVLGFSNTTYPVPDHQLHERKREHPAVAQVSAGAQRGSKISSLCEQPRVRSHAEQDRKANRDIGQPVLQSGQGVEGSGCEIGETEEREEDGDEGGRFACFVHSRDVRLVVVRFSVMSRCKRDNVQLTRRIDSPSMKTTFWSTTLRGAVRKNQATVMWKTEMERMSVYGPMRPILT